MTDEQIKQNALTYATDNYGEYDEHDYTDHSGSNMCHAVSEKAFIAGAHSRDEEIKELEKKVSALETVIVTARATLSTQEAIIKDLRNPWNRIMHWMQMPELPKGGEK